MMSCWGIYLASFVSESNLHKTNNPKIYSNPLKRLFYKPFEQLFVNIDFVLFIVFLDFACTLTTEIQAIVLYNQYIIFHTGKKNKTIETNPTYPS